MDNSNHSTVQAPAAEEMPDVSPSEAETMESKAAQSVEDGVAEATSAFQEAESEATEIEEEWLQSERMQRAEAKVDEWGERTGRFVAEAGHNLLRFASRVREEAEDVWAEAQSLRRS